MKRILSKIRDVAKLTWNHRGFHVASQLVGASLYVYWSFHIPAPGKAVLALTVFVFVLTLAVMERRHKALWLILVLAFFYLEDKAIDKDRAESESRQEKAAEFERMQFAKALDQNQKEFTSTMKRMGTILSSTEEIQGLTKANLENVTGGNSYLYYECQMVGGPIEIDVPGAKKGSMILNGFPRLVGHYPLHNVHVEVVGPTGWLVGPVGPSPALEYGTFGRAELGRSRPGLQLAFMPDKPKQFFSVFINTSNGSYGQTILVQKVGGQWLWASRLYKIPGKLRMRTWAAKGFPREELRPEAS